ncbi:MAG: thiol peroxidase [Gammaproteobacteria bacterium]|nr:thiol peroxidase [Gammaproteobacteria bacterium]
MANITLKGSDFHTVGEIPRVGSRAPDFVLTDKELNEIGLNEWQGKKKLLSIFPSIDTPVCALSTKKFNDYAKEHDDAVLLMISADLPFAQQRHCADESLDNVHVLSSFRHPEFLQDYGLMIEDGPMQGLSARAVVVLDEDSIVVHSELVKEVADEPDYTAAIKALG